MAKRIAFAATLGTVVGAGAGFFLFGTIPGGIGVGCAVAASVWGLQARWENAKAR